MEDALVTAGPHLQLTGPDEGGRAGHGKVHWNRAMGRAGLAEGGGRWDSDRDRMTNMPTRATAGLMTTTTTKRWGQ